jgi:hypothetical protein
MKHYRVHAADRDNFNEGWIFIRDKSLREFRGSRRVAKVVYGDKYTYCGVRYADPIDIAAFDEASKNTYKLRESPDDLLFINTWYWRLLGMPDLPNHLQVEITLSRSLYGYCVACFDHPQVIVLLGMVLGFIGTGLGVVGAGLGFIGIGLAVVDWRTFWLVLGVLSILIGLLICLIGLWPLAARVWRGV